MLQQEQFSLPGPCQSEEDAVWRCLEVPAYSVTGSVELGSCRAEGLRLRHCYLDEARLAFGEFLNHFTGGSESCPVGNIASIAQSILSRRSMTIVRCCDGCDAEFSAVRNFEPTEDACDAACQSAFAAFLECHIQNPCTP